MTDVIDKIKGFLEPLLEGTDIFLVNIKVKPVNNIKVYLDADKGLPISACASLNRKLYAEIEAAELYLDGDYSLEVSSPGVDEPLTSLRQYKKNIGRTVLVSYGEGLEKTGVLKEADEEKLVLEIKIPKKKETTIEEIAAADIKKIVVQIVF
jgi:ribosome maturation factor RimP